MTPRKTLRFAATASGGALVVATMTGSAQVQSARDYGFVLSSMGAQFYQGDDKIDCPEGRSPSTQAAFLAGVSAPERARLLRPENAPELEHRYKEEYVYGPNGTDICTDAELFDTPDRILQKPVQSKIGPGMDLDGANGPAQPAPGTCPHDSFTSPSGENGVDNQYFRATACNTSWRGVGGGKGDFLGELHWAESPVVIVVRGVESWSNDPEVEVVVAASPDRAPRDAHQNVIDGGSLGMTQNPRYRVKVRGKIQSGVLTTEPADLILPRNWVGGSGGEFMLNKARIRVRLNDKGELEGDAGGYRPIDNAVAVFRVGGPGLASAAGIECASVRKTMRLLADGDRDPKTGQCTSISVGLDFAAKPAFVFDKGQLVGTPGAGGRQLQP